MGNPAGGGLSVHIVWFIAGAALLVFTLADAVGTLVTTRNRTGRYWPTNFFYHHSWSLWRQVGKRARNDDRRENLLTGYGPVSLLLILAMWVALEILAWSFVWYGMSDSFNDLHTHLDALYFSGVNFFTVGFGDIVAVHGGARVLTVFAAFTGVTTMALVVGFLPTLYGAYSERERQLLLLDDVSGTEVSAVGIIQAHRAGADLSRLGPLFDEWERWAAGVMETHTSYRMLVLFRSRRTGQSWLTALGLLTETSAIVLACLPDAPLREAARCYRRMTELLDALVTVSPAERKLMWLEPYELDDFQESYARLEASGLTLRPFDEAWPAMQQLRDGYYRPLAALFSLLLPPRQFLNPQVRFPAFLGEMEAELEGRGDEPGDAS